MLLTFFHGNFAGEKVFRWTNSAFNLISNLLITVGLYDRNKVDKNGVKVVSTPGLLYVMDYNRGFFLVGGNMIYPYSQFTSFDEGVK